jgi:phosphonate transport system substrate-binding protein
MEPVYRAVVDHVAAALGVSASLAVGRSLRELEDERADAAFLCSPPFLWLHDRPAPAVEAVAAPVLTGERHRGRPVAFSEVIVRTGSAARAFADLRGATFAYNEPWSHSGHGVVQQHLVESGETSGFFGAVVRGGFHERIVDLVAAGDVDGAAVDEQVLAVVLRGRPELGGRVRTVASLGPYPIQPLVVSTRLGAARRKAIADAVVGMAGTDAGSALAGGFVERFVRVTSATYDPIRRARRSVQASGMLGLGTPEAMSGTPGP